MNTKIQRLSGTIAAQSSAQGASGIAVIRVSGPKSKTIIKKALKKELEHMKAELCPFYDPEGEVIDQVIALFFQSPSSYTGEDILEISCHGSIAVADEILSSLYQYGARPANTGEFTRRAFLNDKLDLTQAEAVADLIESTSIEVARAAKNSLQGAFSNKVFSILDSLVELRSLIEASLDFPDEDLEETGHNKKLKRLFRETTENYQALLKQTKVACKIREGLVVAITGKPNVGKSTLLNKLIGHNRAIVSDAPGTTRDTIEVNTKIDGYSVTFVDTAGVRKTDNKIEAEGIRRALEASEKADLIIEVKDATEEKIADAKGFNENHLLAFNKADLLNNTGDIKTKTNNVFVVSALEGRGVNRIIESLSNRFKNTKEVELTITARRRHLTSLKESFGAFSLAKKREKNNEPGDIVAEELLQAQNSLSEITGEYTSEELLDSIFNNFCIGK